MPIVYNIMIIAIQVYLHITPTLILHWAHLVLFFFWILGVSLVPTTGSLGALPATLVVATSLQSFGKSTFESILIYK